MTIVFVHGSPEVAAIWDPLRSELGRDDTVALSPPGFGAAVPEGFGATAPEYTHWLASELERFDAPVDLIGHDWGGFHVIGASMLQPDLVRCVVTDIAGGFDPEYRWHDLAETWRTPGDGEALVEAMAAMPLDDRTTTFESLGMTECAAVACAEAVGVAMSHCILALYRSADEAFIAEMGRRFGAMEQRPEVHVLIATDDQYTGTAEMSRRTATEWGAAVSELDGLGHWWMLQDPTSSAAAITAIVDG